MFKKIHSLQLAKTRKSGKKGFTLVELVIVIAVLAIIAAIAIPTVNGVVANANKATDESNKQAIQMTIKTFDAQIEAKNTHTPSDAVLNIVGTDNLSKVFEAYGTTFPNVKGGGGSFLWHTKNHTVSIGKAAGADEIIITSGTVVNLLGLTAFPKPTT